MRLLVYDMLVNVNGIYYVHVCEQARWARSAGNSAIENLCIIIIIINKFPIYIRNVLCFLFTASSSCAIYVATQWHWNVVILSGYAAKNDSGVTARAGRVADCQTFFWKIDVDFSQSVQVNLLTGIKHESAQQLQLYEAIRSSGKLHRISTLQTKSVFTVWNPSQLWNNVFGLLSLSLSLSDA